MAPQLAWIGLGNMGRGMCSNLVEKGNLAKPLIIFNRTKKRADDLSAKLPSGKSTVVSSVQDAVRQADIIFTCVGDDKAINETIDSALEGDVNGKLFVDCSTVHPETSDALAKRISAKGAGFVAGPVFGAPAMADAGQLIFVLAGEASWTEKVKPYTTGVMGKSVIDFSGQAHGKATLLKVIGNTFVFNMIEALSVGHTLAEKSGLGTDNLHQFIETMFPGPYTAYSNRMRSGDYYKREEVSLLDPLQRVGLTFQSLQPLFQVDLARKDARHALSLAESSGAKVRAVEVIDSHLEGVQKACGAKGDVAGIYGAVRQESGLPFENGA
ncbi:hypothetical protein SLS55_003233 [Diplodia seriata]|uniref:6-phosphogluconate dehydrogenase NADP-binding domain-containing protein n=1 Tax=Diplodia seriata TaxID=420778 RepID=A0ABR3CQ66_9PEZI